MPVVFLTWDRKWFHSSELLSSFGLYIYD